MPKVTIQTASQLSKQDTFERIKNLLVNDKDIKKFDPQFEMTLSESTFSGKGKGKQIGGEFSITDQGPSCTVNLSLDIPLAFYPFKGKIKSVLEDKIAKLLSA